MDRMDAIRRRTLTLWSLVAAVLIIGEYIGTQSFFWIAPATERVYGDRVADLGALAGYGVTVSMLLLSVLGRGWLKLRLAMALFAVMCAGFLVLAGLPRLPLALVMLGAIGLVAVQIAYVRAAAPRLATTTRDKDYVQTRITAWIQVLQPLVIAGLLGVATAFGPNVACLLIAAIMGGLCVLGLAYARRVGGAAEVAPIAERAVPQKTWTRRTVRAAWLNFLDAGRIGALLMITPSLLKREELGNPLWAGGVSLVVGLLVGVALSRLRGRLEVVTATARIRLAAAIGLIAVLALPAAASESRAKFLLYFGLALLVVQFAAAVFEGGIGDVGAGSRRRPDGSVERVSWSGSQFLALNAFRALGFTVAGHISGTLLVHDVELLGMSGYVYVFAALAVLTWFFARRGLPDVPAHAVASAPVARALDDAERRLGEARARAVVARDRVQRTYRHLALPDGESLHARLSLPETDDAHELNRWTIETERAVQHALLERTRRRDPTSGALCDRIDRVAVAV